MYFGGGTPSLLSPAQVGRLIRAACPVSGAEVTLEANPETVTEESLGPAKSKEHSMPQRTYAVVGLGAIGLGMAQSLLRAGLNTIGCNRGPRPLEIFAADGGRTTHDAAEAAKAADVFFLAVVNAAQVAFF